MKETKQWLYVLGTGHATVTRCYNTCFAINGEDGGYFLIDAGGGNGILSQLQKMEIPVEKIRSLFVTHMHTDHVLGVVWMMRMAATAALKGIYQGEFKIYCSKEVEKNLRMFAKATLAKKHLACLDREIIFEQIQDGDKKQILGMEVTFLDIHSAKAEQYGFCLKTLNGKKLFLPEMSQCMKDTGSLHGMRTGCFMRHFAWRKRRLCISPMKSIIQRRGMQQKRQSVSGHQIWFCGIRRTTILKTEKGCMKKKPRWNFTEIL